MFLLMSLELTIFFESINYGTFPTVCSQQKPFCSIETLLLPRSIILPIQTLASQALLHLQVCHWLHLHKDESRVKHYLAQFSLSCQEKDVLKHKIQSGSSSHWLYFFLGHPHIIRYICSLWFFACLTYFYFFQNVV